MFVLEDIFLGARIKISPKKLTLARIILSLVFSILHLKLIDIFVHIVHDKMGQCHAVFFKILHSFSAVVIRAFHFIDDVVFLPKLFIVIDATLGDRGNKKGHLVARADAKGKHQSVCWPESVVFTIRTVIPKKRKSCFCISRSFGKKLNCSIAMRLGCVYRKCNVITKTLQQSGGMDLLFHQSENPERHQ